MTTYKQQLPGFTRLSIEALYLTGAFLGTTGGILLVSWKTDRDILIGIGFIVTALVIQAVSHKSLTSNYSRYYYLLGKIFTVITGFLLFVNLPLALEYRVIMAIVFLGIAIGIHLEVHFTRILWHLITMCSCVFALIFLIGGVSVTSSRHWVIPAGYLLLSLLFAMRYRWIRVVLKPESAKKEKKIDVEELWKRGRIWEIFDLTPDPTKLEIAEKYAEKMKDYDGHRKIETILNEAFAILSVKEDKELYRKSRKVMDCVREKIGDNRFEKKEANIWKGLWTEMKEKYNLRPDLVTTQVQKELCNKYTKNV